MLLYVCTFDVQTATYFELVLLPVLLIDVE